MDLKPILKQYDPKKITIGVLGGHSALDVCHGATKYGFDTVVVCQKGREKTYEKYYRRRDDGFGGEKGCVGNIILVDKFADIVRPSVQKELQQLNTVFIHNRYFWVYCNFEEIERDFKVPIFGSRKLVKFEERNVGKNQYWLLKEAKIRTPKIIRDGLVGYAKEEALRRTLDEHFVIKKGGPLIVKVNEAERRYERAFFVINSEEDYFRIGNQLIKREIIKSDDLHTALIEEFVIGAQINLNFFYSPITKELELMGTDTRRQTSLDGFLRLDAEKQIELLKSEYRPSMIETGHYAVTMKESLVEKAMDIGEKFVKATEDNYECGIIGPFALQGAVVAEEGKEDFVIFDVSMRIPGSPGTKFTPYSGYLYGDSISYGERIAMEIKKAIKEKKLEKILT